MLLALGKVLAARTSATSVAQSLLMKLLVLVLSLGCGMVTARGLGPAGRGEQSAIVLWPYLVSGVTGFGIAPAVCYYTSRSKDREGGLLLAGSLLAFAGGLLGAALGAVVVTYYLSRYSAEIIRAARLILLFTPAILVGYVFRANLEARANFTSANQSRVWPFVQTLVALLGLWWSHLLTPITAALALFVPLAAQSVWLGYKLASHFALSQQRLLSDMRDLLSYGLRTYGTDVFYTLSTQVDLAFIIAFLSPAALGIYTIALTAARTRMVAPANVQHLQSVNRALEDFTNDPVSAFALHIRIRKASDRIAHRSAVQARDCIRLLASPIPIKPDISVKGRRCAGDYRVHRVIFPLSERKSAKKASLGRWALGRDFALGDDLRSAESTDLRPAHRSLDSPARDAALCARRDPATRSSDDVRRVGAGDRRRR